MKKQKKDKRRATLPGQAHMEIKNASSVKLSTGAVQLTDKAVEKGKEWTEFTKL